MKVSIFSESSADEAAILTLVKGILGKSLELIPGPRVRSRGWTAVFSLLPVVLKHLHFQTDAEAVVLVIDSDCSHPFRVPRPPRATFRGRAHSRLDAPVRGGYYRPRWW
jgi:hypothetical protein